MFTLLGLSCPQNLKNFKFKHCYSKLTYFYDKCFIYVCEVFDKTLSLHQIGSVKIVNFQITDILGPPYCIATHRFLYEVKSIVINHKICPI